MEACRLTTVERRLLLMLAWNDRKRIFETFYWVTSTLNFIQLHIVLSGSHLSLQKNVGS